MIFGLYRIIINGFWVISANTDCGYIKQLYSPFDLIVDVRRLMRNQQNLQFTFYHRNYSYPNNGQTFHTHIFNIVVLTSEKNRCVIDQVDLHMSCFEF